MKIDSFTEAETQSQTPQVFCTVAGKTPCVHSLPPADGFFLFASFSVAISKFFFHL